MNFTGSPPLLPSFLETQSFPAYFCKKEKDMDSLLITPKNANDLKLLMDLLQRLKMNVKVLSEEQKEELGLTLLLQDADRDDKVDREEIIKKLSLA